jgi:hypothetical protein
MAAMPDAPRRWLGLRLRSLVWIVVVTTIALSAYSYWSDYSERAARRQRELLSPSPGDLCTVVLRSDALGLARTPPRASRVDGVDNYVEGRFVLMNDQWVVLAGVDEGAPQQWIPRENVLLIQVSEP